MTQPLQVDARARLTATRRTRKITLVSARDLRSSAYWRGAELMVAQRQLDDTGTAMRVTQVVRLPDGSRPANVSVYRKQVLS